MPSATKRPPHQFFRLDEDTMDALDRVAARHHVDRTNMLRVLIHREDEKAEPKPENGAKP